MLARKVAAWLALLSGVWLALWSLYSRVLSPVFGDSRGRYSGTGPAPSLMDDVFTPDYFVLLGAGLVFGLLLVVAFFGLRGPEATTRRAWAVVALASGLAAVFWIGFLGGVLALLAGIVALVEASLHAPR